MLSFIHRLVPTSSLCQGRITSKHFRRNIPAKRSNAATKPGQSWRPMAPDVIHLQNLEQHRLQTWTSIDPIWDSFRYILMIVDVSLCSPFSNFSCLDLDEKPHRASMRMQGTHAPMKSTERINHGMIRFPDKVVSHGNVHNFCWNPAKRPIKAEMTFQQGLKIISTTKGISKEIVKRILKSTVYKNNNPCNQLMLHIWLEFLEFCHWLPNTWQCWQESNMNNQHTSIKHPFWMSNPRLLAFPFVEISFAQPNVEMCRASSEVSHRAFCPGARQDGLHHTVDANICPFLVGVALGLGEFWVCTESCWRNLHVDSSNKPFQWLRWSSVLENRSD